jgi:hypothetical protein
MLGLSRRELLTAAAACAVAACSSPSPRAQASSAVAVPPARRASGLEFLLSCVRPWPELGPEYTFVSPPHRKDRSPIYDAALVSLVLVRAGHREEAGRVLGGLAARQDNDGSLPFSIARAGRERGPQYVRSGALAWVGYAAADYLGASREGPHRVPVVQMAHKIANLLLRSRPSAAGDPRNGLVTGGRSMLRYETKAGKLREILVDAKITWASVEHNIDAFFFLRALARTTERSDYAEAAHVIARALVERAWLPEIGQFARGVHAAGVDRALALDCASWGALALHALGDEERARAAVLATSRYLTSARGVRGHRPYADGFAIESRALRQYLGGELETLAWSDTNAVWPEGTAGVALALARLGERAEAAALLHGLEALRSADGSLPTSTVEVPSELDTAPGIAGTAWFELVRREVFDGAPAVFLT